MLHFYNFIIDHRDGVCLDLLSRLLFPRGMGKGVVFIKKIEVSVHYTANYYNYLSMSACSYLSFCALITGKA